MNPQYYFRKRSSPFHSVTFKCNGLCTIINELSTMPIHGDNYDMIMTDFLVYIQSLSDWRFNLLTVEYGLQYNGVYRMINLYKFGHNYYPNDVILISILMGFLFQQKETDYNCYKKQQKNRLINDDNIKHDYQVQ
ncbi:unnamed protein product [Cunninghamella blakesleeana]